MNNEFKKYWVAALILVMAAVALRPVVVIAHNGFSPSNTQAYSGIHLSNFSMPHGRIERQQGSYRDSLALHLFRILEKQSSNEDALAFSLSRVRVALVSNLHSKPASTCRSLSRQRFFILRI